MKTITQKLDPHAAACCSEPKNRYICISEESEGACTDTLFETLPEDGNDRMKETVQANYRRIKEEVKQIVQEELERIKNDPVLCKLLPDNETV